MKKALLTCLLAPTVAVAAGNAPAIADYFKVHEPYDTKACIAANGNAGMEACTLKELETARLQMNARFKAAVRSVNEESPKLALKLKQNQKTWESTYLPQCEVQLYESVTGSGYGSLLNFCLIQMVNERTSYLNTLIG
jgi:uncharacterized protein YecT (DUF1311 family)